MLPFCRILLVDDFGPFRQFVRISLQARAEFRIVGEALDGMEAIQKAHDLQPDLILLDIGLPKLNGMVAAERIRILAPDAKLVFVSLESSSAIVEEAFRRGARGYIHKMRAQADLIPAIEAVLAGKHFVSSDLEFGDSTKVHRRHEVLFWSDEMVFLESARHFIAEALKTDRSAIVIATPSHRESIVQNLKAAAFDMDGAIQKGIYTSLNAAEALSDIMVNGLPDRGRCFETLGSVIESSVKATKTEHSRISVFGECAPLLWAEGNTNGAIELEKVCNDLIKTRDIEVLCAYPLRLSQRADDEATFNSICAEHTNVFFR